MKWRLLRGNTFTYEKIPQQESPLHGRSSSIPRIRIGSIPRGSALYTNVAAVPLFWSTNKAAVTSCENDLLLWFPFYDTLIGLAFTF